MPRSRDTDKGSQPHADYPLITEAEHDELTAIGKRKYPRTLTKERGEQLSRKIDIRIAEAKSRAKRRQHKSYKYTAAGRRELKR